MAEKQTSLEMRIDYLLDKLESVVKDLNLKDYWFPHPVIPMESISFKNWFVENRRLITISPTQSAENLLEGFKYFGGQLERIKMRCEELNRMIPEVLSELEQDYNELEAQVEAIRNERDEYKRAYMGSAQKPQVAQVQRQSGLDFPKIEPLNSEPRAKETPEIVMTDELFQFEKDMRLKFERGLAFINPKTQKNEPKNPTQTANGIKRIFAKTPAQVFIVDNLNKEYLKKYYNLIEKTKQGETAPQILLVDGGEEEFS